MVSAYDDQMMLLIQAQDAGNLRIQVLHVIAVSLLPKAAEIVEILPDLRGRHMHQTAQLLGGNPLHALILQFTEETEIPGQTPYHCL